MSNFRRQHPLPRCREAAPGSAGRRCTARTPARRHLRGAPSLSPSRVLRPPPQHAAGRGAARHVRDAQHAASVADTVAGRGSAPRVRGAPEPSSAAQAALLRSCNNRAASCAPPRARAVFALCVAPGKQLECACGGGAHTAFQPSVLLSHAASQASAGVPAGTPVTVWVKRMDVAGARYAAVKGVDLQDTVDDFTARWVVEEQPDLRPSHVTLRLTKCGKHKPTAAEEAAAVELDDPSLSLVDAGVSGTAWLMAYVAGAASA
jgi:hypothetical protein